ASGNMAYGLYFGSESNTSNSLRNAAMFEETIGTNFGSKAVSEQNNIDLFVGGDAGVQWGAKLTYSSSKNEQGGMDQEQDALRVAIGGISGDIEAFANIGISNKAENGDYEFDGKSSFDLGASYLFNDLTYMARVQSIQAEDAAGNEIKSQNIHIGTARVYRLNDRSNIWVSAWYKMDRMECDADSGFSLVACGDITVDDPDDPTTWTFTHFKENNNTYIPVAVSLEVAVKEWLTLRGSVAQNIWGENDNGDDEATIANSTEVRAGASLVWGDFQVDGLIGNTTNTNTVGDVDTSAGNGTLRTDALMSRVGLVYRF
ncbi:MAG: hypothetical protein WD025_06980, partial [Bacteriovoracaceae bacterium]